MVVKVYFFSFCQIIFNNDILIQSCSMDKMFGNETDILDFTGIMEVSRIW